MNVDPNCWNRINSFALVSYIPEPLAGFLDRLRQELVPNCFLRAHVTILPPRPICTTPREAWNALRAIAPHFAPFDVELTGIEIFPVSDVIYIGIGAGAAQLSETHEAMNVSGLRFQEAFPYHPHITLAQDLKPDEVDELTAVGRRRWSEFTGGRKFHVDQVVFVQNTRRKEWIDLGECCLGQDDSRLVGVLAEPGSGHDQSM
jgi:2'-5' RNA ligase